MRLFSLLLVVLAVEIHHPGAAASDWPHLRGPESSGSLQAPGTFDAEDLGLELAWKIPLGSGYSGIAIAGGRAVTLYSDAESDWAIAFDPDTAEELWRHRLGDVTKGRDGSDDGPLGSPVIFERKVYLLEPGGRLLALKLSDGKVVWQRDLVKEFGAERPTFGFATTPLVVGDVLVVQAGGSDGRSVVGLDTRTGEFVWSHDGGEAGYRSPVAMSLAGKRHIVAATSGGIMGIDPSRRELFWKHLLAEGERIGSGYPTFIGEDRFLVAINGDAAAFRVSRSGETFTVEELYRTNALGNTYAQPVYHDGHVYGFRGSVLTCIDAESGERKWRSRAPGGEGLILVDGHLVIFGAKGNVVVAAATPDGYLERARLQALEGSGLTWPSFASGHVFVRNLDAIAAVAVTREGQAGTATAQGAAVHEFGEWLQKLETAEDRTAMIDAFFAKHTRMPVVEDDYVHFVYRGNVKDVGIAGSMIDSEAIEPMNHVEGTDLYHRTFRLESGGRWEYRYQIDYDTWIPDPLNSRSVPALEGELRQSEYVADGYRETIHVSEPEGPRGTLESFTLTSKALGYDKEIRVWLPPGYADEKRRYPLLIVNDGTNWIEKGLLVNTLDNLVGKSVEPVVVAFVAPSRRWWQEAGGSRTEEYLRMQVDELLPALEDRYRLIDSATSRAVMGNRFYGFSSAYLALKHPDMFGKVAVQSVYTGLGTGESLASIVRSGSASSVAFYLDWNRYDERSVDRDWDFAEDSRSLAALLGANGFVVEGGEVLDSYGWGGWRNRSDRLLTALYPIR